ncbi:MAG TPA: carboxypeptidase regulatory-like domain-containing protein, partial [Gemmatimonadaceae bacterium]|nr:carboxypeptidase regulatory-like domain-containing protein [Gemmatimonadaceae bacterium]
MHRLMLLLAVALLAAPAAQAQEATGRIVGTVTRDSGEPLQAASVVLLGTTPARGTQTDAAGRFSIAGV